MWVEEERSADLSDRASAAEHQTLQRALQKRKPEGPAATGYCLSCGPEMRLEDERRWCDASCRDDYERRRARR